MDPRARASRALLAEPARLDVLEKADDAAEVRVLVVPHREVAPVLADPDARVRDQAPFPADVLDAHLVVTRAEGERRDGNLRQILPAIPALQRARHDELVRALHRVVDRLGEVLEEALDRIGPGIEAAQVAAVDVAEHRLLVLRSLVVPLRLVALEDGEDLLRQRGAELPDVFDVGLDRGRHVGQDEALHVLRVLQDVLDAEDPAPGMSEQIELLEAQPAPDLLDLLAEAIDRPEARILRLVRIVRTQLVVVEELDSPLRQEVLEALEVLVRAPGAAVERQELDLSGPDLLRPDAVLPVDRDPADAGGLDLGRGRRSRGRPR